MSKYAKRNLKFHASIAIWLVIMHFLDLYWIIMPTIFKKGINVTFLDLTLFLGIGCIYFSIFFKSLSKVNLIPTKDPRLDESVNFHNI